MPKTAFSTYYVREIDSEQLLALIGASSIDAISPEQREWIRKDVVCSSCGVTGAQIVRESKSRSTAKAVRQPHFRFTSPTGQDAHHRFCEFSTEGSKESNETLIDFANERSAETRFVRSLICKGIENRFFDQGSIRAMRQWFFDLKSETRFHVTATSEDIEWMERLLRHPHYRRRPFRPTLAEIPGFNWKEAVENQFTEDHLDLLQWLSEKCRESPSAPIAFSRAKALSTKHHGQDTFDRSVLRPYYKKSLDLAYMIAKNSDFPNKKRPENYRSEGAPTYLLALCALLLFVCDWNLDGAVELFAKLILAPSASDATLGNVIGLNPFHDYSAWETLAIASELAARSPSNPDYTALLDATALRLREEHQRWRDAMS